MNATARYHSHASAQRFFLLLSVSMAGQVNGAFICQCFQVHKRHSNGTTAVCVMTSMLFVKVTRMKQVLPDCLLHTTPPKTLRYITTKGHKGWDLGWYYWSTKDGFRIWPALNSSTRGPYDSFFRAQSQCWTLVYQQCLGFLLGPIHPAQVGHEEMEEPLLWQDKSNRSQGIWLVTLLLLVWVIFRWVHCGDLQKNGCGKTFASINPMFMSTNVPTTIAGTSPFFLAMRGPGMHRMMVYAFRGYHSWLDKIILQVIEAYHITAITNELLQFTM